MKVSKLKKGKIYYSNNGAGQEHIWRFDSLKTDDYLTTTSTIEDLSLFHAPHAANSNHWIGLRKATKEEKRWLKACEKVGKFIPREEVKVEKKKVYKITLEDIKEDRESLKELLEMISDAAGSKVSVIII